MKTDSKNAGKQYAIHGVMARATYNKYRGWAYLAKR
jgi:hypothetical protein